MLPTPALLLLIAALLPLASFLLLVFLGRRMGYPLAGYVATALIAASWLCSIIALVAWFNTGQHAGMSWGPGDKPIAVSMRWIPVGAGVDQEHPGYLDTGIYVDSLTVAMFNMLTLVATLVHLFSIGYMAEDKRYAQFFTSISLFCFSILSLVLAASLLQVFVFWELIGLCSYFVIGFWHEHAAVRSAAVKSFVINRIGDAGFLIGFGILFYHLGNASLLQLNKWLGSAGNVDGLHIAAIHLPNGANLSATALTVIGIALFCGVIGKAAQFPLQTWLADAMEAPAPASALLHGAAMGGAGVYLLGRIFPILTPDAKLFIAIIGVATLAMAALVAMVQSDIKRVLAYSTVSQLGLMMLAMGLGSWVGALFHLIIHAFVKSLLFLGCGSVIHATNHEREMRSFGGLYRKTPVTAITFAIGVLALSGVPFFSGYYSIDIILRHAGAFVTFASQNHRSTIYWLFFFIPIAVACLTAFYLTRCWMLTFWGKPRDVSIYENARESPIMWFPLIVLAGVGIVGGSSLLNVRHLLSQSQLETKNYCRQQTASGAPAFSGFDQSWPVEPDDVRDDKLQIAGEKLVHTWLVWAFPVGFIIAFGIYIHGYWLTDRLLRLPPLRWIHSWLYHEMFFDEMYFSVFVTVAFGFSGLIAWIDKYLIDGAVNLVGHSIKKTAGAVVWFDSFLP